MKASYTKRWKTIVTGKGTTEIEIIPGQFVFGRKTAAKELRMTESTIRNRIEKLKRIGNLTIKPDTHYSIITVCNWERYQAQEKQTGQAIGQAKDNQRTTKGHKQESKTLEEGKEETTPVGQNCPHQIIVSLYNEKLPSLPSVIEKLWDGERKKNLQARWKEDKERQSEEWWENFFESISEMPFLMGEVKDFRADLGWILKKGNFIKILEGKYKTKEEVWR